MCRFIFLLLVLAVVTSIGCGDDDERNSSITVGPRVHGPMIRLPNDSKPPTEKALDVSEAIVPQVGGTAVVTDLPVADGDTSLLEADEGGTPPSEPADEPFLDEGDLTTPVGLGEEPPDTDLEPSDAAEESDAVEEEEEEEGPPSPDEIIPPLQ